MEPDVPPPDRRRTPSARAGCLRRRRVGVVDDGSGGGDRLRAARATTAPATGALATTTAPPPTSAAPASPTAHPGVVEIAVDADTAAGTPIAESVALGEHVRIIVRTATPQEFHLHGYDIDGSGAEVVFDFTADLPGEFVLESHDTGTPLLTLTVA